MEPGLADLELGFEPQTRARSNTWPLQEAKEEAELPAKAGLPAALPAALKKNSSRRNAWGNLSYADLITQAIGSSPNKRLTLSQIYEWMVHNVAYFKDKGDSNSSAGWKNSIRHNLSLHNRFMRVQNEGTGKSSWWMLNPDAKPGKSARRRATSMETSKYEKKRGRVKKKVEDLRRGALDATPSPSSSISESLDLFPESPLHGFQLSPDFRPRTSSNASSCGGRLSPIPSGAEGEWGAGVYYGPQQLADSLEQTMRLGQDAAPGFAYPPPPPYRPAPPYTNPQPTHRHTIHTHTPPLPIKREYSASESPSPPATMMGQMMAALNPAMLDDLNINIESLPLHGTFECNVDEVIKHELSLDGSLDFNFSQQQAPPAQDQPAPPFSGHSWVH